MSFQTYLICHLAFGAIFSGLVILDQRAYMETAWDVIAIILLALVLGPWVLVLTLYLAFKFGSF